jgi:tetratricopeptide (TPR) repeat protein
VIPTTAQSDAALRRASQARFYRSLCALGLSLFVGCRMFGQQGPVSQSVAQSRQLSQRGLSAMERGDVAAAENYLGQAVKVCPADLEARRHYADALWLRGEHELALEHALQALAIAPDDCQLAVRAGQMQLELGLLADARNMANQVLDQNPSDGGAWLLRGRVAAANGELEDALADFLRALEFLRDDRDLLYQTAQLYRQLNRPERALCTCIALRDTYGPGEEPQAVLYEQGLALQALNRPSDAADTFSLALEHGPVSSELLYRLGQSQLAAGRSQDADRSAQQALAVDPAHAPSRALREQIQLASRPMGTIYP